MKTCLRETCPDAARENAKARATDLPTAIHAAEGDLDLGFLIHHTHSRAAATATKIAFAAGATAFGDEERREVVRAVTDAEEVVEAASRSHP